MKPVKKLFYIMGLFLFGNTILLSQTKTLDTVNIDKLLIRSAVLQSNNVDSAMILVRGVIGQVKNIDKKRYSVALRRLGMVYSNKSEYDSAIWYNEEALNEAKKINFKRGMSAAYNNFGEIYRLTANYTVALENLYKGLAIAEELKDNKYVAALNMAIGAVFMAYHDNEKSLEYSLKAMKVYEELKNESVLSGVYGNVGNIYENLKDLAKAEEYQNKALQLSLKIGNAGTASTSYSNLGNIYLKLKKYDKALEFHIKSLELKEKLNSLRGQAYEHLNISSVYSFMKKHEKARFHAARAVEIAKKIGTLDIESTAHFGLYEAAKNIGDYKSAISEYVLYTKEKDSIYNEKSRIEMSRKEIKYSFDRKMQADSIKNVEAQKIKDMQLKLKDSELKNEKSIRYGLVFGLLLFIFFIGFLYNRFKLTQKQNKIIEHQRQLVVIKNDEIMASISYAKHLQDAILPPHDLVKKYLPESFILYKPKDIVAGDFYWFEHIDGTLFIAAADCTGHGVPGAMVSVVCSNALNRAVKEFGLKDSGAILNKVRELVIETFAKSQKNVQDGMDISLVCYDKINGSMKWAGANNPLWYFSDGKLNVITADKQPVGKYHLHKDFTTHSFDVKKGDTFYLFTDGYADQFGGENGKKLKLKNFQNIIVANFTRSMDEQKEILDSTIIQWQGKQDQVDDISIVGFRI